MRFAEPMHEARLGAVDGQRVLTEGLLGTKAQWLVPLGAVEAAPLRWAARALVLLMLALLLAWAGALLAQSSSGRGQPLSWLGLAVSMALAWAWMKAVFRLWQRLGESAWLPLRWGGLPALRPTERASDLPAGWSVSGWPHPLSLHLVFDLGPWVLIRMDASARKTTSLAWFWMDTRSGFKGSSGHHLRALLASPRANEVRDDPARSAGSSGLVASSRDMQHQWSNLLSAFRTDRQSLGGRIRLGAGARHGVASGREFAETVLLDGPQEARRSVGLTGHAGRGVPS